MYKSEIFAKTLNVVSQETEIPQEFILSKSKLVDVVDAKYLFVKSLNLKGFYPAQIARIIGISTRAVNNIISNFESRVATRKLMSINWENIKNQLRGN